jgi:hypothetical protein
MAHAATAARVCRPVAHADEQRLAETQPRIFTARREHRHELCSRLRTAGCMHTCVGAVELLEASDGAQPVEDVDVTDYLTSS